MIDSDDEVTQITHFMKDVARAMEHEAVPDARAMWIRIQLVERQRLAERARRPAQLAWKFAKYWFACSAALFVYRASPAIGSFLLTMPMYVCVAVGAGVTILVLGRRSLKG